MLTSPKTVVHDSSFTFISEQPARICLPTWKGFIRKAFRGAHYEAQDVLVDVDQVHEIHIEATKAFPIWDKIQRRLARRDFTGKSILINPGLRPVRLQQDYDLFIAFCQDFSDLLYINSIENWMDRCSTSICYIDELWAAWIPRLKYWMPALNRFDHVILGLSASAEAVGQAIGRHCHYIPAGVDTLRFSPYPDPVPRVIDVYSIGRKYERVHQALSASAAKKEIFYIHDTASDAGEMQLTDYRQHRQLLANLAKRSRYFIVQPAKTGSTEETFGQIEIGYRYFEGAAAGAIMIGEAPKCEAYTQLFNWPDAVIEINPDGSDVDAILAGLAIEPERMKEISRRNAREALLRHDWMYRWEQMLAIAGLEPTRRMQARRQRLHDLAGQALEDQN